MSLSNIRFFVFKICLLFCVNLSAQEPITYTTKQGLPSNHVYDVTQDSHGFMWFATNRGVVKYDGVTFKTFTVKDGLPNNDTWKLEADFQGRIWYFSKSNYQGYIQNDSIYKFIVPDSLVINPRNISKSGDEVWMLAGYGDDHLTIKDNKLKKVFNLDYPQIESLISTQVNLGNIHDLKRFWVIDPSSGNYSFIYQKQLIVFDKDLNILFQEHHDIPDSFGFTAREYEGGAMPNHTFYIFTGEGVLFINYKTKSSKYYKYQDLFGEERLNYIFCIGLEKEIQISKQGCLLRFNYDFELIENNSFSNSIPNHKSYKDRDGNIWLVDLGKGITLHPNAQLRNKYYLPEKNVQKIGLIKESLFVGINDDGFYEFIPQKDTFINRVNLEKGKVYQISYFSDSQRGYLTNGPLPYVKVNNSLAPLNLNKMSGVKYLVEFEDYLYILASYANIKRDLKTGVDIRLEDKRGLILGEEHKNNLYVGASDGLYILENDALIRPTMKDNLLSVSILSLLSTKEYLIVGTDGRGIYLFSKDEVIHLKNTEDLSILKIIKKEHVIWLGTQKGVFKVDLDSNNIVDSRIVDAYFEEDGLLQNNTNDIYLAENILYAASDKGLVKLDLGNEIYKKKPHLYFKTAEDTLKYSGGERENINIAFAVLDYTNQDNYQYEYRLLPNQKEWARTPTQAINFNKLSPDFYTVEVKATDHHGNQSIANQHIKIVPEWYQTIWASIGFGVLSFILLGGMLKMIQLRIRNKEQEKAQQEKQLAGLELKALRSQMNPHFVHNSLNAILYYIQRSEKELSEKYLVKFSKLIRLFFEYSRRQNITIKDEVDLLKYYLQVEQLRFEDKLEFNITVHEKINKEDFLIPSMILQPIVENSVNHGLFHKPGGGTVWIKFIYIDNISYKVTIKDDGIGIHKSKEIFSRSAKNYQSRSSNVLHERLALLKQSKEWDISYNIEDLSEINRTTGTLVTLTFKQTNN